jgi:predicted RNA-binding Zn ribbon-like protein
MDFSDSGKFLFLAGDHALDLLNTTPVLASGAVDLLESFADLLEWEARAGLLTPEQFRELRRHHGPQADAVLARAKSLRESLREIVFALEKATPMPRKPLAEINQSLRGAAAYWELEWQAGPRTFRKHSHPQGEDLASGVIRPVARSIAALLTERNPALIRKCENPACVLHYYDTSKNHSRRWCSMEFCGNRNKVAAHYRRHRSKS